MHTTLFGIILISLINVEILLASDCHHRDYGNGGTVCVCTTEFCDTVDPIVPLNTGQYVIYTSSKEGQRFNKSIGHFQKESYKSENTINIDSSTKYQSVFGWGGAFTDSTGININSLQGKVRQHLLNSYFSKNGIEYSLCRVPIGGTDFSTHPYTYDDVKGDVKLEHFNLTTEDYTYKIALINEAKTLTNDNLKLVATPWSAPAWMKTNHALAGIGYLYRKYYQTWANYYIKFLEAYANENIHMWGITTGNEPLNGLLPFIKISSVGWTPATHSKWISENLGPTIRKSKFKDLKIIALDDQRLLLPWWVKLLFRNELTRSYVDGIAVHWYWDEFFPASILESTHNRFPEKFILATEACVGDKFYQKSVELGSWKRGEMYAKDIIEDVNNWATGWIDWNMALDVTGGPTYIDNNVDSPVIVNVTAQEFYKQPMYYALGHFSKFIPPNSIRIKADVSNRKLLGTAFLRSDNGTTIVIYNDHNEDISVTVNDKRKGSFGTTVTGHSFNTIVYW